MNDKQKVYRSSEPGAQPEQPEITPWWQHLRTGLRLRWIRIMLIVVGLSSTVFAIVFWRLYHGVDHQIVIHYTTLFGIDRLGPWWWLVIIALAPIVVVVFNMLYILTLRDDQNFIIPLTVSVSLFLIGFVDFGLILVLQANRTFLL